MRVANGEKVKIEQTQLGHATPKIALEVSAQAVSADQQRAHRKVVQMVLPMSFFGEIESGKRQFNALLKTRPQSFWVSGGARNQTCQNRLSILKSW